MLQFLRQRTTWTPRRRRGAAVQLVLGGLFLMGVPALLGESAVAAGFRMLAPVAWLMAMAGTVLMLWPAGPRVRNPGEPVPSGLVPLQPASARPSSRSASRSSSRSSSRSASRSGATASATADPVSPKARSQAEAPPAQATAPASVAKERFRDTELQFDDPDTRR